MLNLLAAILSVQLGLSTLIIMLKLCVIQGQLEERMGEDE